MSWKKNFGTLRGGEWGMGNGRWIFMLVQAFWTTKTKRDLIIHQAKHTGLAVLLCPKLNKLEVVNGDHAALSQQFVTLIVMG